MTFTDDDLRRLKKSLESKGVINMKPWPPMILALLARLEAAENLIRSTTAATFADDLYQAWLRACGK